jgi:hypothetical protein
MKLGVRRKRPNSHLVIAMSVKPLTSEQLTTQIQLLVREKRLNYLDAVLHFCEQRGLEPESIAPLLGDKIKAELTRDAESLNLIPKSPHLPV